MTNTLGALCNYWAFPDIAMPEDLKMCLCREVDAQACRLHLSTALQPLGVVRRHTATERTVAAAKIIP